MHPLLGNYLPSDLFGRESRCVMDCDFFFFFYLLLISNLFCEFP